MSPPGASRGWGAEIEELLRRQHDALQGLFVRYCLSDEEALRVMNDTLFALVARRPGIGDLDRWLLETVEDACRREAEEAEEPPEETS